MGISSMPAPKDSLLAYVLYNTAVSVATLAGLVRAALVFLGLAVPAPWEDGSDDHHQQQQQLTAIAAAAATAGPTLAERFRSRFRPSRFGRRRAGGGASADCRVCLARFEPESMVNRLPCGHLFHRACLETWLDYDHTTCPLCRLRLLPAADDAPSSAPAPRLARI
ncbi:probable E3 ubiquitin-protein ligase XERICO [Phragmites australis]|uniref:probable E3 ubiquitin-protein ligase XERICO n=1 Tax=Phragmites australis TaxID=29695 RepID=UPI002D770C98|nr:probable E3 ubiquitin-protein ligase XERICO [Phragmites australis]